jgi:NDP-sugar pyrophosphorylase family protein
MLWHVMARLKSAGVQRIVVNVHHFSEMVKDYLRANDHFGMDIRVSDESDKLLDTGGGVRKARGLFDPDSPVLIHNVDILSNADLDALFQQGDCDGALLVSNRQTRRYLLFDDGMRLCGWEDTSTGEQRIQVDKAPLRRYAFSGIHLLSPRLLGEMEAWPERFSIIDFYLNLCKSHQLQGYLQPNLQLLDIGKPDTLAQASDFFKMLQTQH